MKADITRKSIKALRKVTVKYGIFEYIETPLVDEELNEIENLSSFGISSSPSYDVITSSGVSSFTWFSNR